MYITYCICFHVCFNRKKSYKNSTKSDVDTLLQPMQSYGPVREVQYKTLGQINPVIENFTNNLLENLSDKKIHMQQSHQISEINK